MQEDSEILSVGQDTILLADDHPGVRWGFQLVVETRFPQFALTVVETWPDVLEELKKNGNRFILAILDLSFHNENIIGQLKGITSAHPEIRFLITSATEEKIVAPLLIEAGISGFFHKGDRMSEVEHAITKILNGGLYFHSETIKLLVNKTRNIANPFSLLTKLEMDVLTRLLGGMRNVEIAQALNIGTTTVSEYKRRIMERTNSDNYADLILQAQIHGLI